MFEYIKFERTPCNGTCPWYEIKIQNDGQVTYNGKAFVYEKGVHEWEVSKNIVDKLDNLVNDFGFRDFELEFLNDGLYTTCMPGFVITVKYTDGYVHTIEHDEGIKLLPAKLRKDKRDIFRFVKRIETILKVRNRVDPQFNIYKISKCLSEKEYIVASPTKEEALKLVNERDCDIIKIGILDKEILMFVDEPYIIMSK